jgi:hypothetical protein
MTLPSPDPAAALTTRQLCDEVMRLAKTERETESLLCLHLAELADRFERHDPALDAFSDVYQLARERFGMSVRRVRERVRIGRALRDLPRTEQAFVEGAIGYTQVREVTRVAKPESEREWLESACELPLRALERQVAEASAQGDGEERSRGEEWEQAPDSTGEPAGVDRTSPEPTEVGLVLPAATWALVQRAMEGARRRSGSSLSDAQALEAVARDALAQQAEHGATSRDPGGARRGEPSVTPGGHDPNRDPDEQGGEPSVTPGGHDQGRDEAPLRSDPESDHDAGGGGVVAGRLLSLTGRHGAWHPDRLCQESGFSPSAVMVALLELVLARQVTVRADGCYERVLPRLPRLPRRAPDQPRLACQAPRSAGRQPEAARSS